MTDSSFDKIKRLVKIIGGKVIVVEDGEPAFVVIGVDEYFNFEKTKNSIIQAQTKETEEEKINKDVEIWKTRQNERKMKQFEIKNDLKSTETGSKEKSDNNEIIVENL